MTRPKLTAAMLRKPPRPKASTEHDERAPGAAPQRADRTANAQPESTIDNPSFRAPQFGIKPKTTPTVHIQRQAKRHAGS
ncbi:MAG: hypothetical protein AB1651_06450 [Pseudomonadota bacterium]|jgi:hypothetical protein